MTIPGARHDRLSLLPQKLHTLDIGTMSCKGEPLRIGDHKTGIVLKEAAQARGIRKSISRESSQPPAMGMQQWRVRTCEFEAATWGGTWWSTSTHKGFVQGRYVFVRDRKVGINAMNTKSAVSKETLILAFIHVDTYKHRQEYT